jgi:hypothetical protein
MNMRILKQAMLLLMTSAAFVSCSDDDEVRTPEPIPVQRVSNLHAPTTGGGFGQPDEGPFTKFDFSTGSSTTSDTEWDIAFRGLTIIVNGGESSGTIGEPERNGDAAGYVAIADLASVIEVDEARFTQDTASEYAIPRVNGEGWYDYNFQTNIVTAIPGRTLVFRTRDGRYAKVEIISYYKDAPANGEIDPMVNETRYFTFDYVYNEQEGDIDFEN